MKTLGFDYKNLFHKLLELRKVEFFISISVNKLNEFFPLAFRNAHLTSNSGLKFCNADGSWPVPIKQTKALHQLVVLEAVFGGNGRDKELREADVAILVGINISEHSIDFNLAQTT